MLWAEHSGGDGAESILPCLPSPGWPQTRHGPGEQGLLEPTSKILAFSDAIFICPACQPGILQRAALVNVFSWQCSFCVKQFLHFRHCPHSSDPDPSDFQRWGQKLMIQGPRIKPRSIMESLSDPKAWSEKRSICNTLKIARGRQGFRHLLEFHWNGAILDWNSFLRGGLNNLNLQINPSPHCPCTCRTWSRQLPKLQNGLWD